MATYNFNNPKADTKTDLIASIDASDLPVDVKAGMAALVNAASDGGKNYSLSVSGDEQPNTGQVKGTFDFKANI